MGRRKMKRWLSFVLTFVLLSCTVASGMTAETEAESMKEAGLAVADDMPVQAEGTTAFGRLLSDELNEGMEGMDDTLYSVTGFKISDKRAFIEYLAEETCCLVLALYDDEGTQLLVSAETMLDSAGTETMVEFDTVQMPETFLVKAFFLDRYTGQPLAQPYEDETYTREFQEFLAKTTEDFPEEQIMNLDEDSKTNFVVFREGTVQADSQENKNRLASEENGTYVIEYADEEVQNLKPGDVFTLMLEDENKILKVKSCKVSGTTVTLTEDEAELEDIFSYIKIEADSTNAEVEKGGELPEDGLTFLGIEGESGNARIQSVETETELDKKWSMYDYKKSFDDGELSAALNMSFSFNLQGKLRVYYDGFKKLQAEVEMSPSIKGSLHVNGELYSPISLGSYGISPVAGVRLVCTPSIELKISASMEYDFSLGCKLGCGWKSEGGFYNKSAAPECSSTVKMEGKIYMGVRLKPEVIVLSEKVFKMGITAEAGVEESCTMEWGQEKDENVRHRCESCLDGEATGRAGISAGINFLNGFISETRTLWNYDKKLDDFYYSFDFKKGGLGHCPYFSYKTVVSIVNNNGKAQFGVSVLEGTRLLGTTNKNGRLEFFLSNGEYTLTARNLAGDKVMTKNITVSGEKASVEFRMDWEEEKPPQTAKPNPSEKPGGDGTHGSVVEMGDCGYKKDTVKYILYGDGTMYIYGSGMMGWEEENPPWFNSRLYIKNLVIGEGVLTITMNAFKDCSNIVSVSIPSSVMDIGGCAFNGCSSLPSVKIPYGIVLIRPNTFAGCTSLYSVEIPATVTTIYDGAFYRCESLESIQIPDSVRSISGYVFAMCSSLKSIKIPDGVPVIEYETFYGCSSLTSVVIPNSVTRIGEGAFGYCSSLTGITLPNSVASIGERAFVGCTSLKNITIPNNVGSIGNDAFGGCESLTGITLPDGVASIGDNAFSYCLSLETIVLPDSVNSLGKGAFSYCFSLTEAVLSNKLGNLEDEMFLYCTELTSITIPDGIKSIGAGVFNSCASLESIIFSNSVTSIGSEAFKNCTVLTSVEIPASVESIGEGAFDGCAYDLVLYGFPDSYAEKYAQDNGIAFQPLAEQETTPAAVYAFSAEEQSDVHSYTKENVTKGKTYLFVVVRNEHAVDLFSPYNLLYIDQKTAGDTGSLTFYYKLDPENSVYKELILDEAEPVLMGDIDNSGAVDLNDVQQALKAALNIVYFDGKQMKAADVDRDGRIRLKDARRILRIVLKIE